MGAGEIQIQSSSAVGHIARPERDPFASYEDQPVHVLHMHMMQQCKYFNHKQHDHALMRYLLGSVYPPHTLEGLKSCERCSARTHSSLAIYFEAEASDMDRQIVFQPWEIKPLATMDVFCVCSLQRAGLTVCDECVVLVFISCGVISWLD